MKSLWRITLAETRWYFEKKREHEEYVSVCINVVAECGLSAFEAAVRYRKNLVFTPFKVTDCKLVGCESIARVDVP